MRIKQKNLPLHRELKMRLSGPHHENAKKSTYRVANSYVKPEPLKLVDKISEMKKM